MAFAPIKDDLIINLMILLVDVQMSSIAAIHSKCKSYVKRSSKNFKTKKQDSVLGSTTAIKSKSLFSDSTSFITKYEDSPLEFETVYEEEHLDFITTYEPIELQFITDYEESDDEFITKYEDTCNNLEFITSYE